MSAVKSRLKLFEQSPDSEDMANVAKGRPPLANKPNVMAKFPLKATEEANVNNTNKPGVKLGPGPAIKQDELFAIKNSLNKGSPGRSPEVNNSHEKEPETIDFRKVALKPPEARRVSVPKVFQGEDDVSKSTDHPPKLPQVKPMTGLKTPLKTQDTVKQTDVVSESVHQTPLKTWGTKLASGSPQQSANNGSTPIAKSWGNKNQASTQAAQTNGPSVAAAATSVAKSWQARQISTTTSQTTIQPANLKPWMAKQSSPSTNGITLATHSPPATSPTLQPSTSPALSNQEAEEEEQEKGKFDFRSHMKQRNSLVSEPKSPLTDITPKNNEKAKSPIPSSISDSKKLPDVLLRFPNKQATPVQDKKRQSSNMIIERKSDNKNFKKVKLSTLAPESSKPAKPALPTSIDLTQVKVEYQKKIQDLQSEADAANDGVTEEIYEDGSSTVSPVLPRRPTFKRNSERVSLIPDMAPEEEGDVYDDGTSTAIVDEIYADGETEKPEMIECDDVYEDEESFSKPVETEEDKKKRLKEEAEAKKREEKERKDREKQEKEQKKKEEKEKKERMKLLKKFNLTGKEAIVGQGTIKQDAKGSGLTLTVKKDQTVTILRLNDNPPNKWLVKIDENIMGYVDSSNIEIDTKNIKQTMGKVRKNSKQPDEDDQPTYDDVPPDTVADEIEEEIYEEL
ncbi:FYN-binding protein 1-like isoform X2 [Biomphalaria glabrata]|uniref:FYN-binding protein 1-like isoform X2 n=1 Tax=Biomphalaria glabrata TaxID=6526 RepID=A0A9W3AFQ4_BIOGL|nr:FYN-binding protein 1-like isoform X2 [Biomphalaria glabrata]XP_055885989.1 FYN-binding protein 1-like isoform X2 [Biomphalaria glabrata]XP_055885990.1 FYN-binding protein 1-like isoform X2 [Biomphalaria glabrata]KAI8773788.1 transcription initiation factor TFIID subunit 3 isoform X2 [Biomphalaria glabrata]